MATSLLSSHLEQISLCASSIAELDFPQPKQFTNALLARQDITALIRDTELHERALFSIAPPPLPSTSDLSSSLSSAQPRYTQTPRAAKQPKRNTAVAAVLGRDLFRRVREADTSTKPNRAKGEVDVEVLLEGATRLCKVYPLDGAAEEIAKLRARYEQLSDNIAHYEGRVARNGKQLEGMAQRQGWEEDDEHLETASTGERMTREDLEREEREVRELERKKGALERRVGEMEKDLGGLMR